MSTLAFGRLDAIPRPRPLKHGLWIERLLARRTAAARERTASYIANLPEAVRARIDPQVRARLVIDP